jgi:hypothetical protein
VNAQEPRSESANSRKRAQEISRLFNATNLVSKDPRFDQRIDGDYLANRSSAIAADRFAPSASATATISRLAARKL